MTNYWDRYDGIYMLKLPGGWLCDDGDNWFFTSHDGTVITKECY